MAHNVETISGFLSINWRTRSTLRRIGMLFSCCSNDVTKWYSGIEVRDRTNWGKGNLIQTLLPLLSTAVGSGGENLLDNVRDTLTDHFEPRELLKETRMCGVHVSSLILEMPLSWLH
jgi:hypothetical protein